MPTIDALPTPVNTVSLDDLVLLSQIAEGGEDEGERVTVHATLEEIGAAVAGTGSNVAGDGTGAILRPVGTKLQSIVNDGDYDTAQHGAVAALNRMFIVPFGASVTITVWSDVATLTLALTAISQWIIPSSATVTIVLPTGVTSLSSPVAVFHPYGARIRIEGVTPVTTTATGSGSVVGAAGAWGVPLTVASASGIAVGDYALIRSVTGTGQYLMFSGMCKVTGVSGATVTVTNTAQCAAWPTAALSTATVTILKSKLAFAGCDGLRIDGALGSLDKLALVGDKTASTVGLISQRMAEGSKSKGYVYCGSSFGVTGWGDGGVYAQYGGTIDAQYLCVADCLFYNALAQHGGALYMQDGISSGGLGGSGSGAAIAASNTGAVSAENVISVGNAAFGLYAFGNGAILAKNGFAWGHGQDGARAGYGGLIRADNLSVKFNVANGVFVNGGGKIVAPGAVIASNAGVGAYAESGGTIHALSATVSSNGSYGCYADGGDIAVQSGTVTTNALSGIAADHHGTILASSANAVGNTGSSHAASNGGFIRATTGVGDRLNADTGGRIQIAGMTGTLVKTYGVGGVITDASDTFGSILVDTGSNIAIGATNAAGFNLDKASSAYARFARSGTVGAMIGLDDGSSLITGAAAGDTVIRAAAALWFAAGGSSERGFIDAAGSAALGKASLATTATDGFFFIPSCAGPPTGVPTTHAGRIPLCADSTNNKIYAYMGGSWVALN